MVKLTFSLLPAFAHSFQLNGGLPILIKSPNSPQRTFTQLEDLAAKIFNNDPEITKTYTASTWTAEFMEYGCYCNKVLRGGGKLPTADFHESICMDLYACYKCINIDYDHEGTYAATEMVYNAKIDQSSNSLDCLNELHPFEQMRDANHDHDHEVNPDNCPRHVCECDKNFIAKLLTNHKRCLGGETQYCLTDTYRHTFEGNKNFVPNEMCLAIGANIVDHDMCCGDYPVRKPFLSSQKSCCNGELTLSTIC